MFSIWYLQKTEGYELWYLRLKAIIKEGKTKAEAAMVIFEALKNEDQDVVVAAFVQGATLTEKGAVTYWYNCRRKAKKAAKPA